jgi:xanthine/uracil permease
MELNPADARRDVRYQPDESPPNLLALGLGMQYAMLAVPSVVLSPTILIQAAGGSEDYLMWAVCTALAICGVTTAVQAARVGRIGAGYVLLMGSSSAFLAVCVSALEHGGPGLLALLSH